MGINRGFRSFYSEHRRTAPLPQRSLRICFERREKPARRSAIFYLRTYVFNCSERYKIIQLYRIFIWIYCNFMHTYPLENAVPDDAIVKRFFIYKYSYALCTALANKKIFPAQQYRSRADKDLFGFACPTLCVPKFALQDRTSLLRRQRRECLPRSNKALPLSGTPKPSRRLKGIF